jgi:long-chain acyl-CoA synthetase
VHLPLSDRLALLTGRGVTLGTLAERLAAVHGDRRMVEEASSHRGEASRLHLTFPRAAERVGDLARAIAGKTGRGDRVVLALPNGYELLLAVLAAARAGAIPVPLNAELTPAEVDLVAADSGATLVVSDLEDLPVPRRGPGSDAAPADPGDVGAIFYTSGTTGRPKGVRLTHRALLGELGAGALWPGRLHRDEAVFGLPVSHIMGFIAVLGMAVAGIPVYFLPRFRPDTALDAIEERRATIFVGVPAMYRLMDEAGAATRDLRSVRVWASGADAMPADLARKFQRMGAAATLPFPLPGVGRNLGEAAFLEGYGMVETGGGVAFKAALPLLRFLPGDALGVPIPPNRLRVVGEDGRDVPAGQVGELWVKGPGVLQGYHGDEAATAEVVTPDGWLRTGDMARRGAFGLVHFAGRGKDVIKRGGYSVYAVEVEGVLEQHPGVAEAAVVGLPDERAGEAPCAAIRRAPGSAVDAEELVAWARERMAAFKVPARFLFVDELPRTGTRKVRREEVKGLFGALT